MASSLTNTVLGPYILRELIGAGGVAEVYRADHRDDGHRHDHHGYAVKVMRPERAGEKQQVKNFLAEFELLQGLRHASLPIPKRLGEIEGRPAFVMDLVPGSNLAAIQQAKRHYPGVACLTQLCAVTGFLHRERVIHNDLKLENCVLRPDGGLVLVDFGSARLDGSTNFVMRLFAKTSRSVFGTATYLAPELIQGKRPTFRTDVYALAVCAFMLLSGRPPFEESRQSGRLRANLNARPPLLTARIPTLHPAVATIIDRCLSKDPEQRPADATEVQAVVALHLPKLHESSVKLSPADEVLDL